MGEKYCFSCMKKIPLLANKCPYCLEKGQTIHGRVIFMLIILAIILFVIYEYGVESDSAMYHPSSSVTYKPSTHSLELDEPNEEELRDELDELTEEELEELREDEQNALEEELLETLKEIGL